MDRRIRTSLVSVSTDLLLFGIKVGLAVLVGSLALLADAFHSLSDLVISSIILMTLWLRRLFEGSAAPPAPPTGTQGVENEGRSGETESGEPTGRLATAGRRWARPVEVGISFVVSGLILLMAWNVFRQLWNTGGVYTLRQEYLWLALLGTGICASWAYFLSRLKIIVGREEDSPALVADGYHSRMDMFSTLGVMAAILGNWVGIRLDPLVAIVIGLLVAYTGLELFVGTVRSLLRSRRVADTYHSAWYLNGPDRLRKWTGRRFFGSEEAIPAKSVSLCFDRLRRTDRRTWKRIGLASLGLAALAWLASGLYMVEADRVGVRLRFGGIVDPDVPPGLHYRLPWPLESVAEIERHRVNRVEVGFRIDTEKLSTASPTVWEATHSRKGYSKLEVESLAMTGSENLVDLSVVVHWVPRDAVTHRFQVADVPATLRGLTESNLRTLLSHTLMDDLLTGHRKRVLEDLHRSLQSDSDRYGLGIDVVAVHCHDLHPPVPVVQAFRSVFSAWQAQVRRINQAETFRNRELPEARAEAYKEVLDAEAARLERVLQATGETTRFSANAEAARESPFLTRFRLYMETMESELEGVPKIVVDPEVNRGGYQRGLFKGR